MGRSNSQNTTGKRVGTHPDAWKRERPTRHQATAPTLDVDVHGVLFAVVAVVFVIYPLAQWAVGR